MLVLRIEDAKGVGVYCGGGAWKAHNQATDFDCDMIYHPDPYADRGLRKAWYDIVDNRNLNLPITSVRFGFADVEQFHAWFSTHEAREILDREGFHLSVYEVPPEYAAIGDSQAVFNVTKARRIAVLACTEEPAVIRGTRPLPMAA
jgi:hypothetical protein